MHARMHARTHALHVRTQRTHARRAHTHARMHARGAQGSSLVLDALLADSVEPSARASLYGWLHAANVVSQVWGGCSLHRCVWWGGSPRRGVHARRVGGSTCKCVWGGSPCKCGGSPCECGGLNMQVCVGVLTMQVWGGSPCRYTGDRHASVGGLTMQVWGGSPCMRGLSNHRAACCERAGCMCLTKEV
eukprot:260662-Chlamydomonas_euryale.AAC.2